MNTLLSFATAVLVTGATSLAQAPDATAPRNFDLRRVHGVAVDDAGTPWAMGPDFKAAFRDGGVTFVPALGSAAPGQSLAFRLLTIARGPQVLHDAGTVPTPAPEVVDKRVTYSRGLATERYDVRPDGVELSIVIAAPLGGDGDLIVRGSLHSTSPAATQPDGTLLCSDGRFGGVHIGRVTGVDASGRQCAGSMRCVDGELELRLPAAFVAAANYPLVLDPLIGTAFVAGSALADDGEVDAAYDDTNDTYLVVWSRTSAVHDADIWGQRVDANGNLIGSPLALVVLSAVERAPVVASVNARNRFVVCWQEGPSLFGPWNIRARSVGAATGTINPIVSVATTSDNETAPAICGDRSLTGTKALVAWEVPDAPIPCRTLDVDAAGVITAGPVLTASDTYGRFRPSFAKSREPGSTVLMACMVPSFAWYPSLALLDYDGVQLATWNDLTALSPLLNNPVTPAVDGDGGSYLFAYWTTITTPTTITTLFCRRVDWDGTFLTVSQPTTLATTALQWLDVAWLGDRGLVAWTEPTANPFDSDLRAITVQMNCQACSQPFTVATVARPNQRTPAIATHYAGSGASHEALLVWNETDAAPPFTSSVVAQRFTAMTGAAPATLSSGCGGGGTAATSGPFAPGNTTFQFTLSGGDPTALFALLSIGDGSTTPLACGCMLTNPLVTHAFVSAAGSASHQLPLPCNAQLLGATLEFQWLLWGAAASPCPLLPNLVASDRKLVTLTP